MTTTTDDLVREQRGPILILQLNRPDARNSLTGALMRALGNAFVEAEDDPDIRAVVLTATGDRAFCAGMDLKAFAAGEDMSDVSRGFERFEAGELTVPVIGAANGTAIGGGLELLLGSDIIVASSAAKFGFPEVSRGLFPGGGGTRIGTRVPLGVALEMTLTGTLIDARRAYEIGLVNAVVDYDDVFTSALALAEKVAANAPLGLSACKELVRLSVTDAAAAEKRLGHWQKVIFTSEDAKEGATAFFEKRSPVWQGK